MKSDKIESGAISAPEPAEFYTIKPWWVNLLAGVAFVMCFVTIANVAWRYTREASRVAEEQNMMSEPPYCPIPDLHERPVVCFVNYEYHRPNFSHRNIPAHLCRHVVLCCLTSTTDQSTDLAVAQGTQLKAALKRTPLYIGFGGPHVNYTAVNMWFNDSRSVETLLNHIVYLVLRLQFRGGAAVMLTDWMLLKDRVMLVNFTDTLRRRLEEKGDYSIVIVLPPRPIAVYSMYYPSTFMYGSVIPIALSHVTDVDKPHMGFLSCLTPTQYAGAMSFGFNVSLESMYEGLQKQYGLSWKSMSKDMGFSFSLAWTYYSQHDIYNRTAGAKAQYLGLVTYNNACTIDLGSHRKTYRDYLTDCQVISDGGWRWFSGLGEEATQFIRAHREIRAIGIFDLEYDDVDGVCRGFKFPQLQALHDVFRQS